MAPSIPGVESCGICIASNVGVSRGVGGNGVSVGGGSGVEVAEGEVVPQATEANAVNIARLTGMIRLWFDINNSSNAQSGWMGLGPARAAQRYEFPAGVRDKTTPI